MSAFVNAVQNTLTETTTGNGMVTYDSSLNHCVDFFFSAAAARGKDMNAAFARAYAESPETAMKLLFWTRDAREGAGERDTFRKLLLNLEATQPESLFKNLALIPEYGRWDDGFVFVTERFKLAYADLVVRALRAGEKAKKILEQLPSMSEDDAQKILDHM